MLNIPSARLTVPRAVGGEIVRSNLIDTVLNSPKRLVYINAGAGYGKTTLLSQVANSAANAVWLSLDGENDIFTFIDVLCEALKQSFPTFDFSASEYLPLAEKDNFISMLASALVSNIEDISADFIVVMDDLHTITDDQVKKLIAYLIKYLPKDAKLCLGSREASWQDFVSFKVRGDITELTQRELAFTREEVTDILGFDNPYLYFSSEGWPLAIGSFKVLLENGVSIRDLPYLWARNFICLFISGMHRSY
jgi:LuxR family maltose regulon positive regulatory protein